MHMGIIFSESSIAGWAPVLTYVRHMSHVTLRHIVINVIASISTSDRIEF